MLAKSVGLRNADAKDFTPPGPNPMTNSTQSLPERPPPLDRNAYDTKFWDFDEWKKWSNSTEGRGSVKMRGPVPFLEDSHGDPLMSASIDAIRRTMRRIFEMMASKDIAPRSWGRLSEHAYLLFHIGVGTTHPELRLCSNDWKANELAKNVYSAWRTARRRTKARAKGVKPEELDQDDLGVCADDDDEGYEPEKKQSATLEDNARSAKRRKPASSSSSSSCTPSPSEHQELELSLVDVVPSPLAVCDNDSETAAIPVPQIKLKNPLYVFLYLFFPTNSLTSVMASHPPFSESHQRHYHPQWLANTLPPSPNPMAMLTNLLASLPAQRLQ